MLWDQGDQEFLDTLILEGALVIKGVDPETGEIVYSFTDRLKDLAPELYHDFMEMLHKSIMSLWEQGFLQMDIASDNPLILPTQLAVDRSNWSALSERDRHTLTALMVAFREGT